MPSISDSLKLAETVLSPASSSPRADAELLLAHVLDRELSFLIAYPEHVLTEAQSQELHSLLERRAQGVPVAYLTGSAWFYGRRFIVNERVLIPRPETEHLVDEALAFLRERSAKDGPHSRAVVVDVGTGSGAIACTVAAELPHCIVYSTERSSAALAVARANAKALGLYHPERVEGSAPCHAEPVAGGAVHLELADLLPSGAALRFDCVIANLPYIPSVEVPTALAFEPREALDGGPDGLREYRRLLEMLPQRLNAGANVLLEAAPPTIRALRELAEAAFDDARIAVRMDYAGMARVVTVDIACS